MRFKWLHEYWTSVIMLASIAGLSLWLAEQGKLDLYVHPRYIPFTTILCAMALICVIADASVRRRSPKLAAPKKPAHILASVLCLVLCLLMLIMRPSSLTSSAASQRGVNSGALTLTSQSSVSSLSSSAMAFEQFSVREWASLLAQTTDPALFEDKPAHVVGFISPAPTDPDVFYVSRFVITCCAVDARPIGVPVYQPGWQSSYRADDWLEVRGTFARNPKGSIIPTVLKPTTFKHASEPKDPYVY